MPPLTGLGAILRGPSIKMALLRSCIPVIRRCAKAALRSRACTDSCSFVIRLICTDKVTDPPEALADVDAQSGAARLEDRPEFVSRIVILENSPFRAVGQVAQLFEEIRKRGVSILLVEQKLDIALDISERCYVMGHGQIVFEGTPADVKKDAAMRKEWLEV